MLSGELNSIFLVNLTLVAHPSAAVLKSPTKLGLYATRNFYVNYHDDNAEKNVSLGVWHILPNYIAKRFSSELGLTEVDLLCLHFFLLLAEQDFNFISFSK